MRRGEALAPRAVGPSRIALVATLALGCSGSPPRLAAARAWDSDGAVDRVVCPTPPPAYESEEQLPTECAEGDIVACLALSKSRAASAGDRALVLHQLEARCADKGCACWAYGEALATEPAADPARAVEVLRRACVAGIENACSRLAAITRACAWADDPSIEPLCGVLRAEGRIPSWMRPPAVGAAQLPPELTGCFSIAHVITGRLAARPRQEGDEPGDAELDEPAEDRAEPFAGAIGLCAIDPSACKDVHPANPKRLVDFCALERDECPRDRGALALHALCKLARGALRECARTNAPSRPISEDAVLCFASDEISAGERGRGARRERTMWFADLDAPSVYASAAGLGLRPGPEGVVLERYDLSALLVRVAATAK